MHKPYRVGRSTFEANGDFSIHFIDELGDTRLIACKQRSGDTTWALMLKRPDGTVVFTAATQTGTPSVTNIAAQSPEVAATLTYLANNEDYIGWSQSVHTYNNQLRDNTYETIIAGITGHPVGSRLEESEQLTIALSMLSELAGPELIDQAVQDYQAAVHSLKVEQELREVLKQAFRSERVTQQHDQEKELHCQCGRPDCPAELIHAAVLARDGKALDSVIEGLDSGTLRAVATLLQLQFGGALPVLLTQ